MGLGTASARFSFSQIHDKATAFGANAPAELVKVHRSKLRFTCATATAGRSRGTRLPELQISLGLEARQRSIGHS